MVPASLVGTPAHEANSWVLDTLTQREQLLHCTPVPHDYPHCWRCHNPLLFRATKQYFLSLAHSGLAERAVDEVDKSVSFLPAHTSESSAAKLKQYVTGRSDWCVSRQRVWGVPVPALLCNGCGHTALSGEVARAASAHLEKVGVVGWGAATPNEVLGRNVVCESCNGCDHEWETDVLDVWFDSGVSHYAAFGPDAPPADLYLEGSDQYRGWFQSSLLASMLVRGGTPTRAFATHAFVVDANGEKMSKSRVPCNVVSPAEVLEEHNPDVLRLWALNADYTSPVVMSPLVLQEAAEEYRKFRTMFRFLLQNLSDFDPSSHAMEPAHLSPLDKLLLVQLDEVMTTTRDALQGLDFANASRTLLHFVKESLSKRYFEGSKCALYFTSPHDPARRACQTVLWRVLDALLVALAPATSFLCEEVWAHVPPQLRSHQVPSVHLLPYPDTATASQQLQAMHPQLVQAGETLEVARTTVMGAVEAAMQAGEVANVYQAAVTLHMDLGVLVDLAGGTRSVELMLRDYLRLSACKATTEALEDVDGGCSAEVCCADGHKCPRCRRWSALTRDGVCGDCDRVLH